MISFVFSFSFFLIILALLFGSGVLVLLIFRYQIVHIGFGLGEFHLVHTFPSVPMQKSFPSEHSSKLLGNSFEHLLYSSGVAYESSGHLQTLGGDITDG
jgi:hypothetical protein